MRACFCCGKALPIHRQAKATGCSTLCRKLIRQQRTQTAARRRRSLKRRGDAAGFYKADAERLDRFWRDMRAGREYINALSYHSAQRMADLFGSGRIDAPDVAWAER